MSFFDSLRQQLLAGDPDATADLYTDDAEMLSFEFGSKSGREAIREQYAQFYDFHGEISDVEPVRKAESGDRLFLEFTMQSERGAFELINAFELADGKARVHFTNVTEGEVAADEE